MSEEHITTPLGFSFVRGRGAINFDYKVHVPAYSREFRWTTEPPTEAGLYFYVHRYNGKWHQPIEKRFSFFRGELCEETCTDDGGDYEPIKDFLLLGDDARILGPLPIPEAPR